MPPEGEVIPAHDRLFAAGLINGHHHSHEGFYKGRKDNLPLELWMNYVRPLKPIELSPREVYLRTMIGAIEAVRSGTTTICDDTNQSPRIRPEHVEQVFQAYEDIGIRANVGITLFDRPFFRAVPFVDEEFPKELLAELDGTRMYSGAELLDFVRGLARTRHPSTNRVAYMAAPSAPQRCTEDFLMEVRRMADDFDLPLMIHVQETRMQVVTGQLFYGSTMVEYLDRIGFMKPKTAFIHGIWLNPREIEILARTGVSIQHNPPSNLKGRLRPRAAARTARCRGECQHGHRWLRLHRGHRHAERALSLGAAAEAARRPCRLGRRHRGVLCRDHGRRPRARPRARARRHRGRPRRRPRRLPARRHPFAPLNNAVNQLVYAAGRAEVDLVLVDGEVIEQGGKLTRIDEAAIIAEIRRHTPASSRSSPPPRPMSSAFLPITSASTGAASAWRSRPTPIPPVSATDCARQTP